MSNYSTKVTKVKDKYICLVLYNEVPVVQTKVSSRADIGPAFRDLLRTLDKLGGDAFTSSARNRKFAPNNSCISVKHEWLHSKLVRD
jgi:hypothetical protein